MFLHKECAKKYSLYLNTMRSINSLQHSYYFVILVHIPSEVFKCTQAKTDCMPKCTQLLQFRFASNVENNRVYFVQTLRTDYSRIRQLA